MYLEKTLTGKYALVTGASRGIGQAIAKHLHSLGAFVIGTATQASGASSIQALLGEQGLGLVLDVSDAHSMEQLFARLHHDHYEPTILVNNAGITRDLLVMRMKESDWDRVIDTNLSSAYRLSKACLKCMIQARWGRIINVSSVAAAVGNAGQVNYVASKAGLEGLTRALAREVGGRNITVNAVAPGYINTDMTQTLPEKQRADALEHIPLKRFGEPEDVAQAVGFLASDAAAYITGITLPVNGGIYMG